MSTLNVANITDGTTTVGTSYVVNGSAKAWVHFNGTGTVAIIDSLNASSLNDYGVGAYHTNFTTAMANENFSITFGGVLTGVRTVIVSGDETAGGNKRTVNKTGAFYGNQAQGTFGGSSDINPCCFSIMGDLA